MRPLYSTLSADIYTALNFGRPGKPTDNVPPMDQIWGITHWFCENGNAKMTQSGEENPCPGKQRDGVSPFLKLCEDFEF
jgi:hypothetical protein